MEQIQHCPRCGQGKFPPRYDKCFTCGYLFSERYIKPSPSMHMGISDYEGIKNE